MTRPEADQILSQIIDALVQSPDLVFFDDLGCSRQPVIGAQIEESESDDFQVRVMISRVPGNTWIIDGPDMKVRPARP